MITENPFSQQYDSDQRDQALIARAVEGDKESLNQLVRRHQPYIFNVALKMINHVADAEDVTQEILIKLVTHLSKYDPSKGQFRTWLYRITFHHFLNSKKQKYEELVDGFDTFFDYIDRTPVIPLTATEEEELRVEVEESKVSCMAGMIMCLDREQRLIYVVGELFGIDHTLGGEIFGVSPANFRQKLARARRDLYQWMHRRCGLVNHANPCRCPKKTKGFIANGWVDPNHLKWHRDYHGQIRDHSQRQLEGVLLTVDDIYARLYREHPFRISKTSENIVESIIDDDTLNKAFRLGR